MHTCSICKINKPLSDFNKHNFSKKGIKNTCKKCEWSKKNYIGTIVGIYKITNPVGKVYIGKSINIGRRYREYKRLKIKKQYKIYNSLLKYGFENHTFEVLEECSVEELSCRECYWISYYDSLNRDTGLNLDSCDCEEDKAEKTLSDYTKSKISSSLKTYYNNKKECEVLPVYQYSKKGELIKVWKNFIEISTTLNFKRGYIVKSIREEICAYNYLWSYEDKVFDPDFILKINRPLSEIYKGINKGRVKTQEQKDHLSKVLKGRKIHSEESINKISNSKQIPIVQINKEGVVIKVWKSATEASNILNIYSQNISNCCRGRLKNTAGYRWEYL